MSSVQAGRDQDQGARRARRVQAVGRELRGLGMVAAFGAAGVTWWVRGRGHRIFTLCLDISWLGVSLEPRFHIAF